MCIRDSNWHSILETSVSVSFPPRFARMVPLGMDIVCPDTNLMVHGPERFTSSVGAFQSVDVEAEQVPDAPVLTLLQKNGRVSPTFNLIQLDYKNIKAVLGGTLVGPARCV